MKNRIISLLLVLCMLLTAVPAVLATDTAQKPEFTAYNLVLNESIAVNFKLSGYDGNHFGRVDFLLDGEVKDTISVLPEKSGDVYAFRFKKLSPDQMAKKITANFYLEGSTTPDATITRSVRDYAKSIMDNSAHATDIKTLVMDMLNYGEAFQKYKAAKADPTVELPETDLITYGLDDYKEAYATKTEPELNNNDESIDQTGMPVKWKAFGLTLKDKVEVYYYVEAEDATGLTMKLSVDGKNFEVTQFEYDETCGYYLARFTKLNPIQMKSAITAQIFRGDEAVSIRYVSSIESYAADPANEAVKEVVTYMMKYGNATETWYEGSNNNNPPATAANAIFVSANAEAGSGDGSFEKPYANINEAKTAVRNIKAAGDYPKEGITVYFRGGQYLVDETIVFEEADSGEEGAPVVYRAYNKEKVSFVGGVDIDLSAFSNVMDDTVKSRLAEGMDSKVLQVSLKDLGITDYGEMNVYGHSLHYFKTANIDVPQEFAPELFFNGKAMTISRYPNGDDQVTVREVLDEGDAVYNWYFNDFEYDASKWVANPEGATFTVERSAWTHMQRWTEAKDMWVYGYWKVTWSDQSMPVESIIPETGTIKTSIPSAYGINAGKAFYFYNLLEEIDVPGEYYIDRSNGVLYIYPPADSGKVTMSLLLDTMVRMNGAHDIDLVGIEFKAGRSNGMELNSSKRLNLDDCDIGLFAGYGIYMNSCLDTEISGCHLHDLGSGGIYTEVNTSAEPYATMYKNLQSMGVVVENCEINNFSRIKETYSPAVSTAGVGMIVRNCKIYDSPHMAIRAGGNDTLIENNEIFDVLQTAADGGAIYSGFSKQAMGIVIRNNYFHDIYSSVNDDIAVVYNDDTKDGVTFDSNLLVNIGGSGIFINGGWDNNFRNNVLVNVTREGRVGCIGMSGVAKYDVATGPNYAELRRVYDWPAFQPYPHWGEKLEAILENNAPKYNEIKDNILINVSEGAYAHEAYGWSEENILEDNTIEAGHVYDLTEVGFANIDNGAYRDEDGKITITNPDFTLSKASPIYEEIENFTAYDFSKIGLIGGTVEVPGTLGQFGGEEEEDPEPGVLVYDDFSTLANWVNATTDTTANYSYGLSRFDDQLEITLEAGRANDVFLKYNGTIDNTKKLAFEFDLTVNGDVSSNFEAGLELKNGAKWAVTASFVKGKVKTQWSTTATEVDGQTHKVKIVTDPQTSTVSVYLDDNPVLVNAAYLQSQTSWNTIQFFAKNNDSATPLTAYFDNLRITVVE